MGMTIAIDKSIMNKMPHSCKECPLTYLDTGDDAYFGANERRCVLDDSCVDGMVSERAYDCPLVEAVPKDNVYKAIQEMMKYEHDGFINISLARLDDILKKCGVSEDGNVD